MCFIGHLANEKKAEPADGAVFHISLCVWSRSSQRIEVRSIVAEDKAELVLIEVPMHRDVACFIGVGVCGDINKHLLKHQIYLGLEGGRDADRVNALHDILAEPCQAIERGWECKLRHEVT